ncbi:hypothetical protein A3219_19005 [Salmonella enterica]|nr:hypothetical protein A3219_19005 [Salmonella enterica]
MVTVRREKDSMGAIEVPSFWWMIKATISSSRFSHRSARAALSNVAALRGGNMIRYFAGERRKRLIRSTPLCCYR